MTMDHTEKLHSYTTVISIRTNRCGCQECSSSRSQPHAGFVLTVTAMDGSTQCILPKLPVIRRNITVIHGNVILPVPCWSLGSPSLIYIYFLVGLGLPLFAMIYSSFPKIYKRITVLVRRRSWFRGRVVTETQEVEREKSEVAESMGVSSSAVDRMQAMAEARERRSRLTVLLSEASSPQTNLGMLLMGIAVICSMVSLMIYMITVARKNEALELCGTMPSIRQIVDFVANLYLLFYFLIRVAGADNKQKALTSMFSIVDYFTIPSVMTGVILNRYFTGFNFFRAYNLLWLVDILQHRRVLHTVNSVRLVKLIVLVWAIIIIAAGFLHAAENMGDPWLMDATDGTPLYNGQNIVFWRCFLYVYGRITLLDLSGMRMHTMLGKIIIYGFQILALGIVAQAIPQIMARLKVKPEYDRDYTGSNLYIHVIVCGHVTNLTMEDFLKEFYHSDRGTNEFFRIVVLYEQPPTEDMEILQERYFGKLDYLRGSVMNMKDLNRAKLAEAKATLILANRMAPDADADDSANIMRVVSIKNYKADAQVIVQLSQYHNKFGLQNIPSWNPERGDIVICLAELRLGLLAQSCIAPGFSTLMANFVTTRSFDPAFTYKEAWMEHYCRGTSLEMYTRPLSDAFVGMTFTEACDFCFRVLKIVLCAIQTRSTCNPQILPPPSVKIIPGTMGYFMADNTVQVDRAQIYCTQCHMNIEDVEDIKMCSCTPEQKATVPTIGKLAMRSADLAKHLVSTPDDVIESRVWSYIKSFDRSPSGSVKDLTKDGEPPAANEPPRPTKVYDSTGMFHWCPARPISAVTIVSKQITVLDLYKSRREAAVGTFKNHVVVCVLSQPNSQIIGLASFVLPLRSSIIKADRLQDIILLCDPKYLEKEWIYLYNLPKLHVVKGSALNRSDLRSVKLNTCKMCVILGAPTSNEKFTDPTMMDKSVILATLNVRAMKFSEEEGLVSEEEEGIPLRTTTSNLPRNQTPPKRYSVVSHRRTGYDVPVITDLTRDSNVQFLDDQDEDLPGTEFYLTQPYTGGRAFTASVLDLLMVTSFFNPTVVKSIHAIIFGGASLELERIMAEGAGLIGGDNISRSAKNKDQVSVMQLDIKQGPLSIHAGGTYGGLFIDALTHMGVLVLGLYRRLEPQTEKRYVISSPPETFEILEDDKVFALKRANFEYPPGSRMSFLKKNKPPKKSTNPAAVEEKLQDLNANVAQVEERYDNLVRAELHVRNSLLEIEKHPTENQPLLESAHEVPDQLNEQLEREKRLLGDELRIMEQKLAGIKQDVATMQELYGGRNGGNASVRKHRRYEPTKFVGNRRSTEL